MIDINITKFLTDTLKLYYAAQEAFFGKRPTRPYLPRVQPGKVAKKSNPTPTRPTAGSSSSQVRSGPKSFREIVEEVAYLAETDSTWALWGDACRFVFEQSNGQLDPLCQINPGNLLYDTKSKEVSMKEPTNCAQLDAYKSGREDIQADQAYALGKTLQFMLTGGETRFKHCDKNRVRMSDAGWKFIKSMVISKTCDTWDKMQLDEWWYEKPSALKGRKKSSLEKTRKHVLSNILFTSNLHQIINSLSNRNFICRSSRRVETGKQEHQEQKTEVKQRGPENC